MSDIVSEITKEMIVHVGKHIFDNWMNSQSEYNQQEMALFTLEKSLELCSDIVIELDLKTPITEHQYGQLTGIIYTMFCEYLEELTGNSIDDLPQLTEREAEELMKPFYEQMSHR